MRASAHGAGEVPVRGTGRSRERNVSCAERCDLVGRPSSWSPWRSPPSASISSTPIRWRNAGVLLDQADQARQEADAAKKVGDAAKAADSLAKAADYLSRYLGFHPNDAGAVARLGLVLEEQAHSPLQKQRAFLVLDKAVRLDPTALTSAGGWRTWRWPSAGRSTPGNI